MNYKISFSLHDFENTDNRRTPVIIDDRCTAVSYARAFRSAMFSKSCNFDENFN